MKVYCIECKHFDGGEECENDRNLATTNSWKEKKGLAHSFKPSVLNHRNDCGWYESALHMKITDKK